MTDNMTPELTLTPNEDAATATAAASRLPLRGISPSFAPAGLRYHFKDQAGRLFLRLGLPRTRFI